MWLHKLKFQSACKQQPNKVSASTCPTACLWTLFPRARTKRLGLIQIFPVERAQPSNMQTTIKSCEFIKSWMQSARKAMNKFHPQDWLNTVHVTRDPLKTEKPAEDQSSDQTPLWPNPSLRFENEISKNNNENCCTARMRACKKGSFWTQELNGHTSKHTHKTRVKSQSMDTTQQICEINPVRLQNKSSLQHPAVVPKRHVSTQLPFLARPFKLIAKKQFWKTSRSQGLRFLVNPNERALASIAIASVFMVVYCQWVLPNMHATVAKYAGHAF